MSATCEQCGGKCCRNLLLKMANQTPYMRDWMELRGVVVGEHWFVNAPCQHLTLEGACAIYENRPQACRDYETDGEQCRATRRALG